MVVARRKTIRQIADEAGVSIATVSRVLNGRDDVSDETRDHVSRVIRANGYTANATTNRDTPPYVSTPHASTTARIE